jgi:hypothetical protein
VRGLLSRGLGSSALYVYVAAFLEALRLTGIPVLAVIGPEYLRTRGRAVAASSRWQTGPRLWPSPWRSYPKRGIRLCH